MTHSIQQERIFQFLNYIEKVESDSSSLVYHTRIFDTMMIEKFAGLNINERSYEFSIYLPKLTPGERI